MKCLKIVKNDFLRQHYTKKSQKTAEYLKKHVDTASEKKWDKMSKQLTESDMELIKLEQEQEELMNEEGLMSYFIAGIIEGYTPVALPMRAISLIAHAME